MSIIKSAAVIAVGLLAFAGCQKGAQDTTAEETAVRAVNIAWDTAYKAGDADGVSNIYGEGAVVLPPGSPTVVGNDAIREFFASDIAANKAAGMMMSIDEESTVTMSGDLAWQNGTFKVSDASGATVDTGKYLSLLQKQDGKWMLIRDVWNLDSAPEAPPAAAAAAEPAAEPGAS
ncbi:MAG: SgcJ/EcaC family oxidoreductase [Steroidobacteraceae bacterium]